MARRKTPKAVFIPAGRDTYDLFVDGRIAEYSVDKDRLADALRRARVDKADAVVSDRDGYARPVQF